MRHTVTRNLVVVATTSLAVLSNAALWPELGGRFPLLAFYPAIAVSSRFGGFWCGALATGLSSGTALFFWYTPRYFTRSSHQGDVIALVLFAGIGLLISYLYETLRRRTEQAEAAERKVARLFQEARASEMRLLEAERFGRQQAERASRLKDELVSVVSHELRTPLSSILGWANLLKQGGVMAEDRDRALEAISRNARRQAELLTDLLEVARINSGRLQLDCRNVDLGAVVRDAWESVEPLAEAKGVAHEIELDPGVSAAPFFGDEVRLQQVMSNLLQNAVKFTPKGGRVEVSIARDNGSVELVVADTGRGIRPEFLPHLFEPFRQAETGSASRQDGFGLGLSIVRQLVEAHGGEVSAQSNGPNRGSKFTVRLPVRDPA